MNKFARRCTYTSWLLLEDVLVVERRRLLLSALSETLLRPGTLIGVPDAVSLLEDLFDVVVACLPPTSVCALLDPARPRLAAARYCEKKKL